MTLKAKTRISRDASTQALTGHLEKRMAELRDLLESELIDEKPNYTVSTRARLNEIKELFDLFDFPAA